MNLFYLKTISTTAANYLLGNRVFYRLIDYSDKKNFYNKNNLKEKIFRMNQLLASFLAELTKNLMLITGEQQLLAF